MKFKSIFPFFLLIVFASCSKSTDETRIYISIENQTSIVLEKANSAGIDFGDIAPGETTAFLKIDYPLYGANVSFMNEGEQKLAGYMMCGTPMPSAWTSGKYKFVVQQGDDGFYPVIVEE